MDALAEQPVHRLRGTGHRRMHRDTGAGAVGSVLQALVATHAANKPTADDHPEVTTE